MNLHNKCILCGSKDIFDLKIYSNDYLTKCRECSFVFSNKIPSDDELTFHYDKYHRNEQISNITIKRYNELLDTFEPYRFLNNILDVGCGSGYFLNIAKGRGWNVFGTEFTNEAINICKQKGINCYKGKLLDINFNINFDIITSFEVIEHINNPHEDIKIISHLIRKGGLLYLTTPNFNSINRLISRNKWRVIEYPEHLSYYTPKTLHFLLTDYNFSRNKLKTEGIDIQDIMNSSRTMIPSGKPNLNELIREKSESRLGIYYLKIMINRILNMFRIGDTIKTTYERE